MAEKWLVIDDSATIQRVIKLAFQDYDVQITEADSIQDALRELGRSPSTLVIADAALSGVQSVQDFSRLQQSAAGSAFVILEGSYDHIDEQQFRGAGFRYFLKKPFDAQQLIAITREALGRTIPKQNEKEDFAPPPVAKSMFSMNEPTTKAPPPPPNGAPRSLHEELNNPFEDSDGFDLGLEQDAEPVARFQSPPPKAAQEKQTISHDELFDSRQIRNKVFASEPEMVAAEPVIEKATPNSLLEESSYSKGREAPYNSGALTSMLEPMLRDEMEKIVRQSVEEYCRKHFAELAREYLSREIERLSAERGRLLVDK